MGISLFHDLILAGTNARYARFKVFIVPMLLSLFPIPPCGWPGAVFHISFHPRSFEAFRLCKVISLIGHVTLDGSTEA